MLHSKILRYLIIFTLDNKPFVFTEAVVSTEASMSWLIIVVCLLLTLIVMLIVVVVLRRNRGGNYPGEQLSSSTLMYTCVCGQLNPHSISFYINVDVHTCLI